MPIYTYTCSVCGRSCEELFRNKDEAYSHMRCPCGNRVARDTVYRNAVIGPVFTGLDEINGRMLSPGQRRNGVEIKSKKDIEKWELEHNVYRPEAHIAAQQLDEQRHDAAVMKDIADSGGEDAVYDYIEQSDIMEATGWDAKTTKDWMREADACQRNIESGKINVDALGRNPYVPEQTGFTPDPDPVV